MKENFSLEAFIVNPNDHKQKISIGFFEDCDPDCLVDALKCVAKLGLDVVISCEHFYED